MLKLQCVLSFWRRVTFSKGWDLIWGKRNPSAPPPVPRWRAYVFLYFHSFVFCHQPFVLFLNPLPLFLLSSPSIHPFFWLSFSFSSRPEPLSNRPTCVWSLIAWLRPVNGTSNPLSLQWLEPSDVQSWSSWRECRARSLFKSPCDKLWPRLWVGWEILWRGFFFSRVLSGVLCN